MLEHSRAVTFALHAGQYEPRTVGNPRYTGSINGRFAATGAPIPEYTGSGNPAGVEEIISIIAIPDMH